jgi:hypothetical protein
MERIKELSFVALKLPDLEMEGFSHAARVT